MLINKYKQTFFSSQAQAIHKQVDLFTALHPIQSCKAVYEKQLDFEYFISIETYAMISQYHLIIHINKRKNGGKNKPLKRILA